MERMDGRVAVVTGGASGIGRAMAARFNSEGLRVVIADVERPVLEATAAELGVTGHVVDVSDAVAVEALAAVVLEQFGRVDVLCNNAGVGGGGDVLDLELPDWKWVLDVNLWGVIHGLRYFLPHLVANPDGAHVVNTASMAGLFALPGATPYAASKYAVVGLSESLQQELDAAGHDVAISVLCPGLVRTNIFSSQRNRPDELTVPGRGPRPAARAANDNIVQLLDSGAMAPEQVAEVVWQAIIERRFWIFSHPDLLDTVEQRHARMLADRR